MPSVTWSQEPDGASMPASEAQEEGSSKASNYTLEEIYEYVRGRLTSEPETKDALNLTKDEKKQLKEERQADDKAYRAQQKEARAKARRTAREQKEKARLAALARSDWRPSQTRNTIAVKMSSREFDIAGTVAMVPNWYLCASVGGTDMPDDFMEKEFPDRSCDEKFLYNGLLGIGFNVRPWGERFKGNTPCLFISGQMGPALCVYKYDGDIRDRWYLMERMTIGVDVPVYRNLELTADFSLDKVSNLELAPRFSVGVQWNFGDWNIYDWW
ncbi:MAG: hypothetical protein II958_04420 [Spirochaetia bacterium]|nr:hypothetical protein [Spirochaetia bacterium]